jgi:hypothetical protein
MPEPKWRILGLPDNGTFAELVNVSVQSPSNATAVWFPLIVTKWLRQPPNSLEARDTMRGNRGDDDGKQYTIRSHIRKETIIEDHFLSPT